MKVSLVLLGACVAAVAGHTLHLGRTCPAILPFPNLSIDKVLGEWYVLHKTDTDNTCMTWNITRAPSHPEALLVTETRQLAVLDSIGVDHRQSVTAKLQIPNPEVSARMRVRWPTSLTGSADFTVFDTDYDSYMAVLECDRAGLLHRRSTSILSRTRNIDDMFVERVRRLLNTADVSHSSLSSINHDLCKDSGKNWHVDSDLFGLLPGVENIADQLSQGVVEYDASQLEIVGEGVVPEGGTHRFSGSQVEASGRGPRETFPKYEE